MFSFLLHQKLTHNVSDLPLATDKVLCFISVQYQEIFLNRDKHYHYQKDQILNRSSTGIAHPGPLAKLILQCEAISYKKQTSQSKSD